MVNGNEYEIAFYDKCRLQQDIDNALSEFGKFVVPNLVVIPIVSMFEMKKAAESLVLLGEVSHLVARV
jgi:hypothetical protein